MSVLLPNLESPGSKQHLLLLQSSVAQSSLSLIRHVIKTNSSRGRRTLLFSFLYESENLVNKNAAQNVDVHNYLDRVPGYVDESSELGSKMLSTIKEVDTESLDVIIDCVDTLVENLGTISETYRFLNSILVYLSSRSKHSRLILHICAPSPILPLLVSTSFSPSLTQCIAHPPALLLHLAKEYLTYPPPQTPEAKFWGVFLPITERIRDSEQLVYGPEGEGSGSLGDVIIEIIIRGGSDYSGRRKATERHLEGWQVPQSTAVPLEQLDSLNSLWRRTVVTEANPDPTQNVSFNLQLTPSQQESRARVPLPYAHEGQTIQLQQGSILYDPDSADDIDDDDPDEDLDI
ncbi:hypothetical protein K435DRAFT_648360 [Dendrothele bispora CBS 962.96]|uniref:Elongator complex protein 5 n=1 Tax=Dendrothele bispora (strain CBS 962.96) TaxID=1314807 RepID=A0A4S8MPH4_DENBC|nr:hypothetical protein K435DRAFT_648360 [Dendrothele bispora CBS 962.96]